MSDELPPVLIAALVLAPFVFAVAGYRVAGRGHWAGLLLAAPALLFGLAMVGALFNHPAGPGIIGVLVYAPILLLLSIGTIVRWYRRRG